MRELNGLREDAAIARALGRPVASVVRAAASLFPATETRSGPWTASEVQELKRYIGASTPQVIARILGRSVVEVQAQIVDLGRIQRGSDWSRAEVKQFKAIYGSRTDEDLSRIFARSVEEVGRLAHEHGLKKDKRFLRKLHGAAASRMPRWKPDELEVLREHYPVESNLEIARRLGRSVKSVVSKAHSMGVKKSPERLRAMGRENVSVRHLPG